MEQSFNKDIDDALAYADQYFTELEAVITDNGRNDRLQSEEMQTPETMTAVFPQGWIDTQYSE